MPADLTSGQFKSGPAVEDIFRTMTTGLSGTPMPSYRDSLPEADRWALSYYVLSLSAYKDPLTGQALALDAKDRAALNDLSLEAPTPDKAYIPGRDGRQGRPNRQDWRARPPPREIEQMEGFEVTGPYASAMLMSLGALCIFIWGVLSGALHNSDDAAKRFFRDGDGK